MAITYMQCEYDAENGPFYRDDYKFVVILLLFLCVFVDMVWV